MSNVDVTRDAPRRPMLPIDESVKLPKSVLEAKAKAEAHYAPPAPATPASPANPEAPPAAAAPAEAQPSTPAPAADSQGTPVVVQPPATPPAPVAADPVVSPTHEELQSDSWAARYNSMKGRWEQSQRMLGQTQELLSQMADENIRLRQPAQPADLPPQTPTPPVKPLISKADEENFGQDLVDMARRAAQDALLPTVQQLQHENSQLRQSVQRTSQRTALDALSQAVPNWQQIKETPEWKTWVRLRDVYSGSVRMHMLNEAYRAADAPRVIAFFKGFLAEQGFTGSAPQPAPQPSVQPAPAPRTAAVPLDAIAAPGRARPAPGQTEMPADQPIITRQYIQQFYDSVRRGHFAGRQTEKAQIEAAIFAAQNSGRVRG